jgi:sensor c-di-GMP phosphodiesterase-like protein
MFKQDIPYADIEESLDRATDSLDNFINDCCELAPVEEDSFKNMKTSYKGYDITDTTFLKKYREYCSSPEVNVRASEKKYVKDMLRKHYRVIIDGHNLKGIKLKEKISETFCEPNLSRYMAEAEGQ